MKNIVVYYSQKGSNKYLAEQTAIAMNCEKRELRPRVASFFFLLLASATKLSWGNRKIQEGWDKFDSVIICGPIWMGQFIAPLYDFVKKYKTQIQKFHFISCCGSTDGKSKDKFGYDLVFEKARELMGRKMGICKAFPIELIVPDDKKNDDQAMMNMRLTSSNFYGPVKERFDTFINEIKN